MGAEHAGSSAVALLSNSLQALGAQRAHRHPRMVERRLQERRDARSACILVVERRQQQRVVCQLPPVLQPKQASAAPAAGPCPTL
jgi:hypothetical protein